ncbi:MAG TPA: NADH-quinone oxidoreductase subunit C [Candidatus Krumholzibacteria bacterium]|nr:NADH-quinone oxidoreductase subunit C [Candidatus Krumholzibacteria bacterium]
MASSETAQHDAIVADLKNRFGARIIDVDRSFGDCTIVVDKLAIHEVLAHLRNEKAFDLLMDMAGVDCMNLPSFRERFELNYMLYSVPNNVRLRVEVPVAELDMDVPTATDLWRSANWAEREAFEMFGFNFVGHPCLKRLLTHHEFKGHPLRKDYPIMAGQWCSSTSDMSEELNEPR